MVSNFGSASEIGRLDVVAPADTPSRARRGFPASAARRRTTGRDEAPDTARAPPDRSRCRIRSGAEGSAARLRSRHRRDPSGPRVAAARAGRAFRVAATCPCLRAGAPSSTMSRCFLLSLPNGMAGSMPNVRCSPASKSPMKRASPCAHGGDGPVRPASCGHRGRRAPGRSRTRPRAPDNPDRRREAS